MVSAMPVLCGGPVVSAMPVFCGGPVVSAMAVLSGGPVVNAMLVLCGGPVVSVVRWSSGECNACVVRLQTRFFWQWSHISEDVSSSFLFIKDFWGGLPDKVDAAVQWSDNYIYFFRRKKSV